MPRIEHPCVWRGAELSERPDWRYELAADEVAVLEKAALDIAAADLNEEIPCGPKLPGIADTLNAVQHSLEHGSGATLIRGLPVARYDAQQATRMFWALACHLGTPLSQSAEGRRIFHVRDEGFAADDPRTRGPNTRRRLAFHTDRCDVIAFLCLRAAKAGGENYVVSSAALYNEIDQQRPDLRAQLMQPYFFKRHNVDTANQLPYCRQPIFSFRDGAFACSYLRVLIDRAYAMPELPDMTDRQREALDYLEQLAEDPRMHVRFFLEPGDILLLNNWVTLHRRSEFEDFEEPQLRRHLLRIWLSMPNSRPLDPVFASNFGSVDAGAVRGGIRGGP